MAFGLKASSCDPLILSNVTLLMKIGKETVNHSFIEFKKKIVPSLLELILICFHCYVF